MADEDYLNAASDAPDIKLPGAARHMAVEYRQLWEAFQKLDRKPVSPGRSMRVRVV